MSEPRTARLRSPRVCFHGIGSPQRELEPGEAAYWISRDTFLSVLDTIAHWPATEISFDDANASDIEIGLAALEERALTATFFVLAGRLNTAGSLSDGDVRRLAAQGMRIGTHGMNHRPWRGLDAHSRRVEFVEARAQIAEVTGRPVSVAALPLGRYDRALLTELKALDYQGVYTSDRRISRSDAWLRPRFSVRSTDTAATLAEQIAHARTPFQSLKLSTVGLVKRLR